MRHTVEPRKIVASVRLRPEGARWIVHFHHPPRKSVVVAGHHLAPGQLRKVGEVASAVRMHRRAGEKQPPVLGDVGRRPRRQIVNDLARSHVRIRRAPAVVAGDVLQRAEQQRQHRRLEHRREPRPRRQHLAQHARRRQRHQAGRRDAHAGELHVGQANRAERRQREQEEECRGDPHPEPPPRHDPHPRQAGEKHQRIHVRADRHQLRQEFAAQRGKPRNTTRRSFEHVPKHIPAQQGVDDRGKQHRDRDRARDDERPPRRGSPPAAGVPQHEQTEGNRQHQHRRPLPHEENRHDHASKHAARGTRPHRRGMEERQRRREHRHGQRRADRSKAEHPEHEERPLRQREDRAEQSAGLREPRRAEPGVRHPRDEEHEGEEQHVRRRHVRRQQQPQRRAQDRVAGHPGRRDHAVDDPSVPVRHVVLAPGERPEEFRDPEKERGMVVRIRRREIRVPEQRVAADDLGGQQRRGQRLRQPATRIPQHKQRHGGPRQHHEPRLHRLETHRRAPPWNRPRDETVARTPRHGRQRVDGQRREQHPLQRRQALGPETPPGEPRRECSVRALAPQPPFQPPRGPEGRRHAQRPGEDETQIARKPAGREDPVVRHRRQTDAHHAKRKVEQKPQGFAHVRQLEHKLNLTRRKRPRAPCNKKTS